MDTNYEIKYHKLEKDNWWFVSRRAFILQLLPSINKQKDCSILDIGCAGGQLLSDLTSHGYTNLYGIDLSIKAINLCHSRGLNNTIVMDARKLSYPSESFDVIVASDVLEHISHPEATLREWRRILKPRGVLLIFVPAFQSLWSSHDDHNKHIRRYTKKDLVPLLTQTDLVLHRCSYWNVSLLPIKYLASVINRVLPFKKKNATDQLVSFPPVINKVLTLVLLTENWFVRYINMPLGVSIWAMAEKV
jgi:SAM-dependent methyltransferase